MTTEPQDWFPLVELTTRLAQLVWVEEHIGDLLDEWAGVETHHRAAISFVEASGHHRWHAQTLRTCLPTSEQLAELATPRPPTEQWQEAVTVLRGLTGEGDTVARLLAIVREVDPWLARESAVLLELARPIADAALIRWLGFVEIDHRRDGGELAELLDGLQANTVSLRDRTLVASLDLTVEPPAKS